MVFTLVILLRLLLMLLVRVDDAAFEQELYAATEDAEMEHLLSGSARGGDDFEGLLDSANADFESFFDRGSSRMRGSAYEQLGAGSAARTDIPATTELANTGQRSGATGNGNGGIGTHLPETVTNPPAPTPAGATPAGTGGPLLMVKEYATANDLTSNLYKLWFPNSVSNKVVQRASLHGYLVLYRTADEYFKAENYAKSNSLGYFGKLPTGKSREEL